MNQMFEPNQSQLPLAEYLRPKIVGEIVGQKHILGRFVYLWRTDS